MFSRAPVARLLCVIKESWRDSKESHARNVMVGGLSHLHVQVEDVFGVHVVNTFAYLPHEDSAGFLREHEVVINHPLKKLTAFDPARTRGRKS